MSAALGLEPYFEEAASWAADRARQSQRTARIAWRVAAAGWVCALAGAAAIVTMMPLKSVEPFVIRVDNSTGIVDVVPVADHRITPPEAVTRYFLSHYLTICERFNFATAESDYEECAAFHGPQRNQAWYAAWARSNARSPLNVHKDGSTVRAQVTAVTFFKRGSGLNDLAQVRYLKVQRAALGGEEIRTHWIATIQYAFSAPATDPAVRRWNPLGFKVLDFQSEPEVTVEPSSAEHGHES
jgi:type IV secretion system protein VirB8